jgi:hypothetical protein
VYFYWFPDYFWVLKQTFFNFISGGVKVKIWLQERHSKHWVATLGMRQSKLFSGRPLDKLTRDLLASDRKQCRLVPQLLTCHCTFEVVPTYHRPLGKGHVQEMWGGILLPYTLSVPTVTGHRSEIFSSAWLQLTDIRRASVRFVLARTLWSGLFEGSYQDQGCTMDPAVVWVPGVTSCPPRSVPISS